ncbi:MAG: pyruvate dehydrogenase (acetyl-transferring) E1 component subunit alpha [Chloroflexi bacterium]|nr:pyruvate dehydrogenase (acetyl-transferring) E1 component subunit alpha [Chloroflexota bacterium]
MNRDDLLSLYRQMVLIRRFEERAAEAYAGAKIGGFLHLYIGEEAVAVGAVSALKAEDHLFTHYRDHGYALARGLEPRAVMAELFGKATGVSKGKGGSMHLADVQRHFWGGYAIVGGHLPLATGMALACQYQDSHNAVLCVMGEGSTNIGEFHEALNLAALWHLPILYLVENNCYGMGTLASRASAEEEIYRKACAYGMSGQRLDGMDVLAVRDAVADHMERARRGGGPALLEAMTYRYRGHSMADPELYRHKEEVQGWKLRDPIRRLEMMIQDAELAGAPDLERIRAEVEAVVEDAVRFADQSPAPAPSALFEDVYAEEAVRRVAAARRGA